MKAPGISHASQKLMSSDWAKATQLVVTKIASVAWSKNPPKGLVLPCLRATLPSKMSLSTAKNKQTEAHSHDALLIKRYRGKQSSRRFRVRALAQVKTPLGLTRLTQS